MKRTLLALSCLMLMISGCLKDTLESTYTYTMARPVYRTAAEVRSSIKNLSAEPVSAPGKMYLFGSYIFLNELNKGVHIINNSNPAAPVNEAFIAIPGCGDMAVLGNTLYADCYTDLMAIDISNPKAVVLKNYVPDLFPDRRYILGYTIDSAKVITDWVVKDTTVTQKMHFSGNRWFEGGIMFDSRAQFTAFSNSAGKSTESGGKGGSMARFAISHAHLYAVTTTNLIALDLAKPEQPVWKSSTSLPWGVETIYPFKDKLFIGANSGMHIFTVDDPSSPQKAGTFLHARVCDPVIADDDYAYVTLRSGSTCAGFINQLDVVNIENIYSPKLLKSYPLTNPKGLDKDGNYIYVCDGTDGVKVLDATNINNVTVKKTISLKDAYDVICWNKVAIVSAADGMHQYDIRDVNNIKQLSFIGLKN
jgi:LVIVD repeat